MFEALQSHKIIVYLLNFFFFLLDIVYIMVDNKKNSKDNVL